MASTPTSSALATATPSLSLQVHSVDDLARLARVFAASGLFGRSGNPDTQAAECAIRLMAGMEAGFTPFASATGIHIINGKPAFSANLLAQAIKRHPLYDYRVIEQSATACRIRFLLGRETLGESAFTMEMAERAGLLKNPTWKSYPESMLFARALSSGMRVHCPDALGGSSAYVPEELGDESMPIEVVTVTEPTPAPELDAELLAQAYARCCDSGLSDDGLMAFIAEITNGEAQTLDQLPVATLERLVKSGVSAETVTRCNGPESTEDLPAAWAA